MRDPQLAVRTLRNPFSSEEEKFWAFLGVEEMARRFKEMTNNFGTLNEAGRIKYKEFKKVLFPPAGEEIRYSPSKLKYQIPAPLMRIWELRNVRNG